MVIVCNDLSSNGNFSKSACLQNVAMNLAPSGPSCSGFVRRAEKNRKKILMKKIKIALMSFLALLSLLWMLADSLVPVPFTYGAFRTVFMQYSGTIAMGAMSLAMLLALRPTLIEAHLGGLDKIYRLHKWLGITALLASLLHWWWGQGTKWMTQWGWLARPPRGARPNPADLGLVEGWLRTQRGLAESVGE